MFIFQPRIFFHEMQYVCSHILLLIFVGLFVLLRFESSLYILNVSPLPDTCKRLLPICGLPAHFLNRVFERAEVFNFDKV